MTWAPVLGFAFGFISAIPVAGPVSALILSQGMKGKFKQGRLIGLGAGVAESIYTFIAFWGFTHLLAHLGFILVLSNAVAAALLIFLGVYFFRSQKMRNPKTSTSSEAGPDRALRAFLLGAGISAVNPSLIATWTAFITSLYSMKLFEFNDLNAFLFSLGVAGGIFAWFALQLKLIRKYRDRINAGMLDLILKAVGILLFGLAFWLIYQLVRDHLIN